MTKGRSTAAATAGVDTWSVCWYLREGSRGERAIKSLATEPAARSKMLPDQVAGHRVGWFPGSRLLFAEGHPDPDGLCRADRLPEALDRVTEGLCDIGLIPPAFRVAPQGGLLGIRLDGTPEIKAGLGAMHGVGFGGIRRMDSTVDLKLETGREGLALLAGVAAVPVPRTKTEIVREVGGRRVETVYFRGSSGKRVLGRWYDKGVESGTAQRGRLIRPEDQRRYPKATRLDVEAVANSTFVRDSFVRRFEPLWRASMGVKVATATELAIRINELVEEGKLTPGEAVRAAGFLLLEQADCNPQKQRTRYRTRRLCADSGLVLADGVTEDVEVELDAYIERALDAGVWGCG